TVVSPTRVRFTLHEPWPDFMSYYGGLVSGGGWIVPKKYFEQVGADGFKKAQVGLGPSPVVSHTPGVALGLEPYEGSLRRVASVQARRQFRAAHVRVRAAARAAPVRSRARQEAPRGGGLSQWLRRGGVPPVAAVLRVGRGDRPVSGRRRHPHDDAPDGARGLP